MLLAVPNLSAWVLDRILPCPLKDIPREILPPYHLFLEGTSIDLCLIATYSSSKMRTEK